MSDRKDGSVRGVGASDAVSREVNGTSREELTDLKDRDCLRVGPLGSLCTQHLPGGRGLIVQICSNEIENSLAEEGEKSRRTALILC